MNSPAPRTEKRLQAVTPEVATRPLPALDAGHERYRDRDFGIGYGLKGLAVLVLGGLGSVPGAIAGGLLMGLAEALVPSAASGWRDALAFAILFAVLLLRPSGLLGRRTVDKV